ncbi:MAG: hypothetical protein JO080_02055 [Mucilaginibacter sp.]|nr:hypothetical protein [Mucilaginibacter sp.]
MVKSILTKAKFLALPVLMVFCCAFTYKWGEKEWLDWSNKCLLQSFDSSTDAKLKKWEIEVTPQHFIHLRKTYQHGKQEYFSFHLTKLDSINFLGNGPVGQLQFKTLKDDIIVQTYDDPKGNIDSMATVLAIPVKDMTPEKLDSLNDALDFLKAKVQ